MCVDNIAKTTKNFFGMHVIVIVAESDVRLHSGITQVFVE